MDQDRLLAFYQARHRQNPGTRLFAPLADLLRQAGRWDEAMDVLRDGLARHPGHLSAQIILGQCHRDRGDGEAAREVFGQVLEHDPDNLVALRELARDALDRRYTDVAAAWLERLVELDPFDEEAAAFFAEACSPAGDEGPVAEDSHDPAEDQNADTESVAESDGEADGGADGGIDGEIDGEIDPEVDSEVPREADLPSDQDLPAVVVEEEPEAVSSVVPAAAHSAAAADPSGAEGVATQTLADIYLSQGHRDKALAVLRQILDRQPHRQDIQEKIAALEAEQGLTRLVEEGGAEASGQGRPDSAGPAVAGEDPVQDKGRFQSWLEKIGEGESG